MKDPIRLSCINGALLEAPVYETHYRGSNWLALIDVDPSAPGGLSRKFLPTGKGDCLYIIEQVALFDAVEFGADYTTSMGNKKPKRWYGVVTAKTDDVLVIVQTETGVAACVLAKTSRVDPAQRASALLEERAALLRKAEKLDEEIQSIRKAGT